ncbi:MAG TPA: PH domain-containing protein [Candidatus Binatia bacterium]|nr:PH domain-containing protein [Candidatus Binatia bacterium]
MEEKTVWSGTSSLILCFGVFLLCGSVFLLLLFLLLTFWDRLVAMGTMALAPAFVILLSPLAYALAKALLVKAVKYEISSERIKITTGIFSKQTHALELYRVKDYSLQEPFFYRLFHLGNIVILTSDQSTPQIVMSAIRGARPLLDDIRIHVERRRDLKKVREVDFGPTGDPGEEPS